jgi:hypothetical protein
LDAVEVARFGVVIDPHSVADVEHRERFVGVDRREQLAAGVDGFGDRGEVLVQDAVGDLVKQQSLWLGGELGGWLWLLRVGLLGKLGSGCGAGSLAGAFTHRQG